jgi:hypothetical protein
MMDLSMMIVEIGSSMGSVASPKGASSSEFAALEAELESVDRAIHLLRVPMQHSDMYFSIESHLDLVRTRLELRRARLRRQLPSAA